LCNCLGQRLFGLKTADLNSYYGSKVATITILAIHIVFMPLYMLPVPISDGGTETIPAYAAQLMRDTPVIVTERGKTARQLMKAVAPDIKLQEKVFVEMGEAPHTEALSICKKHLLEGTNVAIVSESGCPGVADPGAVFAEAAHQMGIRVIPVVGPSSILLALMASGLNGQEFAFVGYVTSKKEELPKALAALEDRARKANQTQIFIETPYRNMQILEAAVKYLQPHTRLCIAYDITGPDELILCKPIHAWQKLKDLPFLPKKPAIFLIL
jgi:16S rRNA (cytidine1402-2'-O)-methyltransferase